MMTRAQLYKIVRANKWLAIRWSDNSVFGVNCMIMSKLSESFKTDQTKTNIIGYYPISFHEYIRIKFHYGFNEPI